MAWVICDIYTWDIEGISGRIFRYLKLSSFNLLAMMSKSNAGSFNPMAIGSLLNSDEKPLYRIGSQNKNDQHHKSYKRPANQANKSSSSSSSHRSFGSLALRPAASTTTSATPIAPKQYHVQPQAPFRATKRAPNTRAPRPKYEEQQAFFIWYHRTDLSEPWDQVLLEFSRQFHHRRPKGGLQCKFYRLLKEWDVEKVRVQNRHARDSPKDRVGAFGVVERTPRRFEWMRPHHYNSPPLTQFSTQPPASPVSCSGCSDCGW